jgi:hypothetical protein
LFVSCLYASLSFGLFSSSAFCLYDLKATRTCLCLPFYLITDQSVFLCISGSPPVNLSVCFSVRLSVCLSVWLLPAVSVVSSLSFSRVLYHLSVFLSLIVLYLEQPHEEFTWIGHQNNPVLCKESFI